MGQRSWRQSLRDLCIQVLSTGSGCSYGSTGRDRRVVPTEDLMAWLFALPPQVKPSGPLQSKIAIIGMACRFPGRATDTDIYWNLFESGRDVHQKIPADRFNVETHFDPTGQKVNATYTPYGCFVEEPGLFDPAFFNMSPREAEQTDPMHRLALALSQGSLQKKFTRKAHGLRFLNRTPFQLVHSLIQESFQPLSRGPFLHSSRISLLVNMSILTPC
jgi:hypothetical protein